MIKSIIATITSVLIGLVTIGGFYLAVSFITKHWGDQGLTIAMVGLISFLLGDIIKFIIRDAVNRKKRGW